jgi:general secretion pathway protein I
VKRGFTLLEVLVATLIMAIAVTALLSNLSVSLRTAGRVTDNDRAALVARSKMDELLLEAKLPHGAEMQGALDPMATGWRESGWRAIVRPFDIPPGVAPGVPILERIDLEIWWNSTGNRRTFALEAFRRGTMMAEDMAAVPR